MALERGKMKVKRIWLTKAKWMHGPGPVRMTLQTE